MVHVTMRARKSLLFDLSPFTDVQFSCAPTKQGPASHNGQLHADMNILEMLDGVEARMGLLEDWVSDPARNIAHLVNEA